MAAIVMNIVRPQFSVEAMQRLYNLTPFVVIGTVLLGAIGLERRLRGAELARAIELARNSVPPGNPLTVAARILRDNPQTRGFFAFIFVSIFAIFLQDSILEIFGAEAFGMTVQETTRFQPTWGGGVLAGMLLMGVATLVAPISKKTIALAGCWGTAAGIGGLAFAAMVGVPEAVIPSVMTMGLFTGFFNVGALAMMMDMTVEGATGLYMGLWGVAQAFGTGLSSIAAGALHSGFIGSGLLTAGTGFGVIFGAEALAMVIAALILRHLSTEVFRRTHLERVSRADLARAMESGSAA
jgi:BCD family chlorophyll transporter-like MFS transporter